MPTTYTHDRFGEAVLKKLPDRERRLVERHKNLFSIGLHGPDIFFYYNPLFGKNKVTTKGSDMHCDAAADFFLPAIDVVKNNRSEAALVYLLGFACHFILDSCCHPYINRAQNFPGCTHGGIESELDRYYMNMDGKDPFTYLPAGHLDSRDKEIRELVPLFPELTEKEIRTSIAGLRGYTGFMVCRTTWKQNLVLGALKLAGAYDSYEGNIIRREPVELLANCVPHILPLYEKALVEAPDQLLAVCKAVLGKGELGNRFDRNFE